MATQLEDGSWRIQGERVTFPVRVRDASAAAAVYLVGSAPARALLEGTGVAPVSVAGRTPLVLVFVDYRDGDLGAYHELGVAFVVRAAGGRFGAYIHQLPVTQPFTMEAGRSLWGLPKWLARMQLSFTGSRAGCRLAEDDEQVLSTTLRTWTPRLPGRIGGTVTTLAPRGDALLVTRTRARVRGLRVGVGGGEVRLGAHHAMAAQLSALGLPRRAVLTSTVERLELELAPATEVPARAGRQS